MRKKQNNQVQKSKWSRIKIKSNWKKWSPKQKSFVIFYLLTAGILLTFVIPSGPIGIPIKVDFYLFWSYGGEQNIPDMDISDITVKIDIFKIEFDEEKFWFHSEQWIGLGDHLINVKVPERDLVIKEMVFIHKSCIYISIYDEIRLSQADEPPGIC
jgi:hypothetical protein